MVSWQRNQAKVAQEVTHAGLLSLECPRKGKNNLNCLTLLDGFYLLCVWMLCESTFHWCKDPLDCIAFIARYYGSIYCAIVHRKDGPLQGHQHSHT